MQPKAVKRALNDAIQAITDYNCIEHGNDYTAAIEKYGVSYQQIYSWVRKYNEKGAEGLVDKQKMTQSMSRVGRCIDNGPMEGFWGILKCEMYYLSHFETYEELAAAIEQFIHYYNHQRRQHKLNCLPPATYRSLLEAA